MGKRKVAPPAPTQPHAEQFNEEPVHGNLNGPVSGLGMLNQTIRGWSRDRARSPDGYLVVGGEHWKRLFEAARLLLDLKLYDEQDERALRLALSELMRAFRYDQQRWQRDGVLCFDESMVTALYILDEHHYAQAEAMRDLHRTREQTRRTLVRLLATHTNDQIDAAIAAQDQEQ